MLEEIISLTAKQDLIWLEKQAEQVSESNSILEIGSFLMGSALIMAKVNPKVPVYAVDIGWLEWLDDPENETVHYLKLRYPELSVNSAVAGKIRNSYLKKVKNLTWQKTWSRSFVPPIPAKLCYIDANHSTLAVLADFFHCWDIAAPGAIIAGDDFAFPEVAVAVKKIELVLEQKAQHPSKQLWFFKKPEVVISELN